MKRSSSQRERQLAEQVNRQAARLETVERQKHELLALLAHELRGPLAPMMNAVQVLHYDPPAGKAGQDAVSIIERQLRHMARMVDALLELARLSQATPALATSRIELTAVVQRAIETYRPSIESRQHRLTASWPGHPIWLAADAMRIEQAIGGLLVNAAKYTQPGGSIEVSVQHVGERARVSVRDNGSGMQPELLSSAFDLFVQGERTPDRMPGGLGIGLSLVKSIVELHGGSVEAHSEGVGKGAEFVIELPVEAGGEQTAAAGAEPTPPPPARVLVVDDNEDAARSLAMLLELSGYEVRTAGDGATAIAAAREFHPDLMCVDIGLPGMDGYAVAERIRADSGLHDTRLIALTGYGQHDDKERSRRAGFDHHLVKPVDPGEIEKLVAAETTRKGWPNPHSGAPSNGFSR